MDQLKKYILQGKYYYFVLITHNTIILIIMIIKSNIQCTSYLILKQFDIKILASLILNRF